jgi:surface polysaccharide O-acyltransferase-like enzyme
MKKKDTQIAYIQWLRVFAAAAVVLMHTAAKGWYAVPADSPEWAVLTWWDSLVRWPVPVFLMITGALFLPKKTEPKRVLTHYIPRLAVAWTVWSGICAMYSHWAGISTVPPVELFLSGHYHLWYLPFLCGLYLTLPFLQKIAEDDRLTDQLIGLSFVIGMLIPWAADAVAILLPDQTGNVRILENHLHYTFFFDLLALPLLGHRLHKAELTATHRRRIYISGLLGVMVTGIATIWISRKNGACCSLFFENTSPFTLCAAAAVFVFAKYNLTKLPRAVERLAGVSFGIYLCHALLIEVLMNRGIHTLAWNPIWSVPVLSGAVFAGSVLIAAVMKRIPLLGKYLA